MLANEVSPRESQVLDYAPKAHCCDACEHGKERRAYKKRQHEGDCGDVAGLETLGLVGSMSKRPLRSANRN